MLKPIQAADIVQNSIIESSPARRGARATEGATPATELHKKLADFGFNKDNLRSLIEAIAASPTSGVVRYQHYIDSNQLYEISPETTIGDLSDLVVRVAVGKLCSNPHNPHPQTCCPYPAKCPQCGYPVR
jgi:hypothetical protein